MHVSESKSFFEYFFSHKSVSRLSVCEDSSTDSSTTNGDESGGGPPKPVPVCNQCHRVAREERRTAGLADMAEEEGDEDDDDDEEEGATDEDMFAYGGEEEEDFA